MPHNLFLHSEIIQSRQWNLEDDSVIKQQLKYEFKDTISRGCDLGFEWQGIEYGIFPAENNQWLVCLLGDDDSKDIYYNHVDDVMNHKIGDDRLIDICTKFTVIERSL